MRRPQAYNWAIRTRPNRPATYTFAPWLSIVLALCAPLLSSGSYRSSALSAQEALSAKEDHRLQVAERFAPVIYQALGPTPRADYITNFDFDGDWAGDNNWQNCDSGSFSHKAYVYYNVLETRTHYLIHYAFFHPQDYKGGKMASEILETAKGALGRLIKIYDPTGIGARASLSHENDMEGCLIVAEKKGGSLQSSSLFAIETLAHDRFQKYSPHQELSRRVESEVSSLKVEGDTHIWLYVEARGHGVKAYTGLEAKGKNEDHLIYRYTGIAEDPHQGKKEIGYALIPIIATLWPRAHQLDDNATYGEFHYYGPLAIYASDAEGKDRLVSKDFGKLGSAFKGRAEGTGVDKARPPWGWFDMADPTIRIGDWFFDPARVIKNHFELDESFSTAYVYHPYFRVE